LARWEQGALLVPLVGFQPVWAALKVGQVTVLLGAMLTFAAVYFERAGPTAGQPSSAGRSCRLEAW